MREWCIPDDSNVDVWRTVPQIQDVLVREVAAFEDRLVEMGYLNASGNERKLGAATSPSGLSVLVNQDDIGSPIDVNLTMNRDSPMEVSSPPTEEDKENVLVRSSLSEIAHSFLQTYSEHQRSKILRRARTILDSTDYHNSVQVGKFVPPPSETGTLEHLDEDPLDAFVFHQCSISITAQMTLELVRQTLDEAIQPEMSQELDALPPMLYRASREVLDLFRAVVPTLYASEIGSIPRMAAILHNDCVFLAHEASLLGK
jgi:centromere/kinetochore protein ZW10